ncbi:hypothetical protein ACFGXM_01925 [Pasteurella multocida]
MRTLTEKAKEKLAQIVDTGFSDELVAAFAYILLTSKNKNKIRTIEFTELKKVSALSDAYNGRYSSRNLSLYGISRSTSNLLLDFQNELKEIEDKEDFIFDKVEELAEDLDSISNIKLLKAMRNVEIANEEVLKQIKELENVVLVEKAEEISQTAKILGLPALTGSPKQVEWAERIRKHCIEHLPSDKIGSAAHRATTAKYWIDNFKHVLPRK